MNEPRIVTVFGANDPAPGEEGYEVARRVGLALGELGYGLANGGYGGTMEASARGAKEAGAATVGVTCTRWRSKPNAFIDREISTDDLFARVERLIEVGTGGYVVLPGATGTLVELATAWELVCKRLMPARPLVCMGEFWRPVIDLMSAARPGCAAAVAVAAGPEELARHFPRVADRMGRR